MGDCHLIACHACSLVSRTSWLQPLSLNTSIQCDSLQRFLITLQHDWLYWYYRTTLFLSLVLCLGYHIRSLQSYLARQHPLHPLQLLRCTLNDNVVLLLEFFEFCDDAWLSAKYTLEKLWDPGIPSSRFLYVTLSCSMTLCTCNR